MIHYDDPALKHIEDEINIVFDDYKTEDYTQCECLLRARKYILNEQALAHQAELLPNIIAFNDALRTALLNMYNHAHKLYEQVSAFEPNIELTGECYLPQKYPSLHPYQEANRQELWDALCDTGWNPAPFSESLPDLH